MNEYPNFQVLNNLKPNALAQVKGSMFFPEIQGGVWLYQTGLGVLVVADIEGLPKNLNECDSPIFAFHIHDGKSCTGSGADPFADVGMHYNPKGCPHPYHAGDLPPLFSANGNAFSVVLTNRFSVDEIVGRTVVIHSKVDDFKTQPSGDAGTKIACGEIKRL